MPCELSAGFHARDTSALPSKLLDAASSDADTNDDFPKLSRQAGVRDGASEGGEARRRRVGVGKTDGQRKDEEAGRGITAAREFFLGGAAPPGKSVGDYDKDSFHKLNHLA